MKYFLPVCLLFIYTTSFAQKNVNPTFEKNIKISMTENGDPLENAVAERINGIVKEEYLETYEINCLKDAKELLKEVVELYNSERPHMSISNLTPNHIHHSKTNIKTEKLWKNYYRKKSTIVNPIQD